MKWDVIWGWFGDDMVWNSFVFVLEGMVFVRLLGFGCVVCFKDGLWSMVLLGDRWKDFLLIENVSFGVGW